MEKRAHLLINDARDLEALEREFQVIALIGGSLLAALLAALLALLLLRIFCVLSLGTIGTSARRARGCCCTCALSLLRAPPNGSPSACALRKSAFAYSES